MSRVSVIIINWKSKDYLRECLGSIRRLESGAPLEIVVLDNNSGDGAAQMLATDFPEVQCISASENLGFARGNNLAARQARGELLLFLNPDTVLMNAAITTLRSEFEAHPEAWIAGPKLLNSDGSVQTSCIQAFPSIANQLLDSEWLRSRWPRSHLWGTRPLVDATPQSCPVDMVPGACLMIRRDAFERVGRFDERYFMYFEDMDLCRAAKAHGAAVRFVPRALLTHHGGGSSRQKGNGFAAVNAARSLDLYFRKWNGSGHARLYRALLCLAAATRLALWRVRAAASSTTGGDDDLDASVIKWKAILGWSIGRPPPASR